MTIAIKKIWLWIVHHWKVVIIGALSIALLVVSRKHSKAMSETIQSQTEKYRAQMAELDKINNQANAEEREAVEEYIANIKKLDDEQHAAFEALDEEKKKRS
jgi:archaellum biogenesis ATPase FlaH